MEDSPQDLEPIRPVPLELPLPLGRNQFEVRLDAIRFATLESVDVRGPPVPFLPNFLQGGFGTLLKLTTETQVGTGTLILTSLLEDLVLLCPTPTPKTLCIARSHVI